jgi:hypothetical protein
VGEDFKASLTINRDLTIDLNGQTLLTNVVVNAGKIVTFKNGTLAGLGQSYTIFNKGGILTLEDVDVTVYGTYDALRNESGVATIDGGTYAGKINATGGQVTIEDGEFDKACDNRCCVENQECSRCFRIQNQECGRRFDCRSQEVCRQDGVRIHICPEERYCRAPSVP